MDRYARRHRAVRGGRRLHVARARDVVRPRPRLRRRRLRPRSSRRSPAGSSRARRWRGRWPPRPTCCCSTSRPTTSTSSRWSGWSRRCSALDTAIVMVAHDRWFLETRGHRGARARGRPLAVLPRHVDAVAHGAGGARDRAGQGDREAAGRDRAAGALRRALPREGDEGRARRSRASEAPGQDGADHARPARPQVAGVRVQEARALRPRDLRARGRPAAGRLAAARCCWPTPSCGSSAASTSRSSGPTAPARRR